MNIYKIKIKKIKESTLDVSGKNKKEALNKAENLITDCVKANYNFKDFFTNPAYFTFEAKRKK